MLYEVKLKIFQRVYNGDHSQLSLICQDLKLSYVTVRCLYNC
jgi:hypothetical protein